MRIAIQGLVSLMNNAKNENEVVKEAIEIRIESIIQFQKRYLITFYLLYNWKFKLMYKQNKTVEFW